MNKYITPQEITILHEIDLPPHSVIFDIGCSYGEYTLEVIKSMGDKPFTVHCFEPVGDFFNIEVLRLGGYDNIKLNNIALMSESGNIPFCRIKSPDQSMEGCSSFILRPEFQINNWPYQMTTVPASTVDEYCSEHSIYTIEWMKIDVEGAELAVLKGARDWLSNQAIDRIQFEYGTTFRDAGITVREILDLVHPLGYELCNFNNGRFEPLPGFVEDYSFANYYLIRRDLL